MIYFIQDQRTQEIKIGYTGDADAASRMRALQTGNPGGLVLLHFMPGQKADEDRLHEQFRHAHVRGEWFRPVPELLQFLMEASKFEGAQTRERELTEDQAVSLGHFLSQNDWPDEHDKQIVPTLTLICPICGFDYNHHEPTKEIELGVRGTTKVLSFWGECGHVWSLAFGFHKGNMCVAAVYDPADDERRQTELESATPEELATIE